MALVRIIVKDALDEMVWVDEKDREFFLANLASDQLFFFVNADNGKRDNTTHVVAINKDSILKVVFD